MLQFTAQESSSLGDSMSPASTPYGYKFEFDTAIRIPMNQFVDDST